uniref:Uncharacterized protein n=1 Tax=Glossina palpalis gambiensis TaxID=67801 RepID=A0A1B0BWP9_9MUSC
MSTGKVHRVSVIGNFGFGCIWADSRAELPNCILISLGYRAAEWTPILPCPSCSQPLSTSSLTTRESEHHGLPDRSCIRKNTF